LLRIEERDLTDLLEIVLNRVRRCTGSHHLLGRSVVIARRYDEPDRVLFGLLVVLFVFFGVRVGVGRCLTGYGLFRWLLVL